MKKLLFVSLLSLIVCSSCSKKRISGSSDLDAVQKEVKTLNDSINQVWREMIASDDQKIADIKRLLDEVSYAKEYNQNWLDSARQMQQKLKSQRFTQETMTDSAITSYDLKTDQLIKIVNDLVGNTPELQKHSLALKLIEDIHKSDADVIVYRVRYDRWVKEYNQKILQNKKALQKSRPPYNTLSTKALFELPANH